MLTTKKIGAAIKERRKSLRGKAFPCLFASLPPCLEFLIANFDEQIRRNSFAFIASLASNRQFSKDLPA